jgi:hypothetical protein
MFIYLLMFRNVHQEKFDDTKGVIRGHKLKKKQCNIKAKRNFFVAWNTMFMLSSGILYHIQQTESLITH